MYYFTKKFYEVQLPLRTVKESKETTCIAYLVLTGAEKSLKIFFKLNLHIRERLSSVGNFSDADFLPLLRLFLLYK